LSLVTPAELQLFLELTQEIERLEAALETANRSKQALAQKLYERHGRGAFYKVGDKYWMVVPTRAGTYFFAPRVRWPKEARAARAEQKRLDRIARLQGLPLRAPSGSILVSPSFTSEEIRVVAEVEADIAKQPNRVELTATLSRSATQAGSEGRVSPLVPLTPPLPPAGQSKRHLPLVGDVDRPTQVEPRLLQIQEPDDER